jgi:hypothetical protein
MRNHEKMKIEFIIKVGFKNFKLEKNLLFSTLPKSSTMPILASLK